MASNLASLFMEHFIYSPKGFSWLGFVRTACLSTAIDMVVKSSDVPRISVFLVHHYYFRGVLTTFPE